MFKIGDRVVIRKDSVFYTGTSGNPIGISGVVIKGDGETLCYYVDWDNGHVNTYGKRDLEYASLEDIMDKFLEEYGNENT